MHSLNPYRTSMAVMRSELGIVVPVYFPNGSQPGDGAHYLEDTVYGLVQQVDDPAHICLSVDGPEHGREVVEALGQTFGVSTVVGEKNMGKLKGVTNGMRLLLEKQNLRFLAIVDADGDHFPNELLNAVRVGMHAEALDAEAGVMVLGRRISLHHPMGFPRGELEILADNVLLEALRYHAAVSGQPLRLELALHLDDPPDFHSGLKLFSRKIAEAVFLAEPKQADVPDSCYYRHAVEAVMSTEALLCGAQLAVINRSTLNEQPVTTFGLLQRQQLVADKMIWPLKRLNVPPAFVEMWMHTHLPRLLLDTMTDGQEELEKIRRLVFAACGVAEPEKPYPRPLFL